MVGRSARADLKVSATTATSTPAKPFTQDQVQGLVRSGLGDETGAKAIEQRGIDFAPVEDFMQSLKAAGASEAFLKALRVAKPPEPASAKKPLNQVQVFTLLVGGVPIHRVTMLVEERGIDFEPTDDYLQQVRLGGGDDELVNALRSARVTTPPAVAPSPKGATDGLNQAKKHIAAGMFDEAAKDLSAALAADELNAEAHFYLGEVFARRKDHERARHEFNVCANLDPQAVTPYMLLASVDMLLLKQKSDNEFRAEAIRCLRQVVRLRLSVRADKYSDEDSLAAITSDADKYLAELFSVTGAWSVRHSISGEWKFAESDGSRGKIVAARTGVITGSIGILQAYGPTPPTLGFMWRNDDLDLEGWYVRIWPSFMRKCNTNVHLSLRESDDGTQLNGTETDMPPEKPQRGCTYTGTYQVQLVRE